MLPPTMPSEIGVLFLRTVQAIIEKTLEHCGSCALDDADDRAHVASALMEELHPIIRTIAGIHQTLTVLADEPDLADSVVVDGLGWAP